MAEGSAPALPTSIGWVRPVLAFDYSVNPLSLSKTATPAMRRLRSAPQGCCPAWDHSGRMVTRLPPEEVRVCQREHDVRPAGCRFGKLEEAVTLAAADDHRRRHLLLADPQLLALGDARAAAGPRSRTRRPTLASPWPALPWGSKSVRYPMPPISCLPASWRRVPTSVTKRYKHGF